jgi:serine protease Do
MTVTDIQRALAMSLCALTAGCGAATAQSGSPFDGPAAIEPVDDTALTEQLEQAGHLLMQGGRTTAMSKLIEQLGRTRTKATMPTTRSRNLSNAELYRRAKRSVLVIGNVYKCGKCDKWHVGQASGFVITADGLAVTNHHVVDRSDSSTLIAMNSDGQVYPVKEVVAASEADDLAILQLDATGLVPLPVAKSAAPGDAVRVVSHPDGFHYTLTAGIVARTFYGQRAGEKVPVLQITADFAKGSSGAPVLNDRGDVVGVVSYTKSIHHDNGADKQRNLQMVLKNCTPSSRILSLIDAAATP